MMEPNISDGHWGEHGGVLRREDFPSRAKTSAFMPQWIQDLPWELAYKLTTAEDLPGLKRKD